MSKKGHQTGAGPLLCPPHIYANMIKIVKSAKYITKIAKSAHKISHICRNRNVEKNEKSAAQLKIC